MVCSIPGWSVGHCENFYLEFQFYETKKDEISVNETNERVIIVGLCYNIIYEKSAVNL